MGNVRLAAALLPTSRHFTFVTDSRIRGQGGAGVTWSNKIFICPHLFCGEDSGSPGKNCSEDSAVVICE